MDNLDKPALVMPCCVGVMKWLLLSGWGNIMLCRVSVRLILTLQSKRGIMKILIPFFTFTFVWLVILLRMLAVITDDVVTADIDTFVVLLWVFGCKKKKTHRPIVSSTCNNNAQHSFKKNSNRQFCLIPNY